MFKSEEGSTGRLIQLCIGYFLAYVVTGIAVKYYTVNVAMEDLQFLVYSTVGGSAICLGVVFLKGWYRWADAPKGAYAYIIPSGIFTAVVIPTTTLMYMLPISVMVAMVIMRASVIVIGRAVDEIQIRQGLLKKRVYQEENTAVIFALTAAGLQLLFVKPGDFDFVESPIAMGILGSYIVAYAFRIYIMNYYKNTRPKGSAQNNEWFFSIEQIAASVAMILMAGAVYFGPFNAEPAAIFRAAFTDPHPEWMGGIGAGLVYGIVAFFSVFIFMFKGRTATFANLVNRLTSLVAGTVATLCTWQFMGGKPPKTADWVSLAYILIAVAYLSIAEKKRVAELQATHEIAAADSSTAGSRSGR